MNKIRYFLFIFISLLIIIPNKIFANEYSSDFFENNSTVRVADLKKIDVAVRFFVTEETNNDFLIKKVSYEISNPSLNNNTLYFKIVYYDENYNIIAVCDDYKQLSTQNESDFCEINSNNFIIKDREIKYYKLFIDIDKIPHETYNIENNGEIVTKDLIPCSGDYCITKYIVNMRVNEDNSYDITEKITANYIFPKHGIIRRIPLKNYVRRNDGTSSTNRARVTNISVDSTFDSYNENSNKIIKIGDADKLLTGEHTYTISYKYDIGNDRAKNYDELYFNLIGNEWDTSISNVEFVIEMPKDFDKSKIGFSTGSKGTIGSTQVEYNTDGNIINGSFNGTLDKYEGITIRIELPDGYYEYNFNYFILLLLLVPTIFAYFAYKIYKENGIDEVVVETVEFYPPEGLNSLDVGYFYKDEAKTNDAVSLLIYLANKGYIKITDRDEKGKLLKRKNFIITKLKDYDGNDSREKKFLEHLFISKKVDDNLNFIVEKKDLKYSFYSTIYSVLSSTNSKSYKNKVFKRINNKITRKMNIYVILSLAMLYLYLLLIGISYEEIITVALLIAFLLLFFYLAMFGISKIISYFINKNQYSKFKWGLYITISIIGIILLDLYFSTFTDFVEILSFDNIFTKSCFIIYFISFLLLLTFKACLDKRTIYGAEILGKIRGFKRFLETAEKDKLEALVNENPTYFYDILPYAYVLNVSKKWISKFEDISLEPPSWYDTNGNIFKTSMLSSFMNNTMVSASSAMSSTPGSSDGSSSGGHSGGGGFSGGGSSGGGSGGGGGSSW